jgi:hypothetical protein
MRKGRIFGILAITVMLSVASAAAVTDFTKVILLHMNIKDGKFSLLDRQMVYNYPPDYVVEFRSLNVTLLSEKGELLKRFSILDPRLGLADRGVVTLNDVDFTLVVPYQRTLERIEMRDYKNNTLLFTENLKETMQSFCAEHRDDPDCTAEGSIPSLVLLLAGGVLVSVIIGIVYHRKIKTH